MTTTPTPDLPATPEGYTRKMTLHMNFGSEGGAAQFNVFDPAGVQCPFGYQYDTRKGGLTGFSVEGVEGVLTWLQLREHFAKAREVKP